MSDEGCTIKLSALSLCPRPWVGESCAWGQRMGSKEILARTASTLYWPPWRLFVIILVKLHRIRAKCRTGSKLLRLVRHSSQTSHYWSDQRRGRSTAPRGACTQGHGARSQSPSVLASIRQRPWARGKWEPAQAWCVVCPSLWSGINKQAPSILSDQYLDEAHFQPHKYVLSDSSLSLTFIQLSARTKKERKCARKPIRL